jgi:hypothetical protein
MIRLTLFSRFLPSGIIKEFEKIYSIRRDERDENSTLILAKASDASIEMYYRVIETPEEIQALIRNSRKLEYVELPL